MDFLFGEYFSLSILCVKNMATLSSNTLNILNFRRLQQFTWGVCKTKPRLIMQSLHQDGHKVIFLTNLDAIPSHCVF